LPDEIFDHVVNAGAEIEMAILSAPAKSGENLQSKVVIWDTLVAHPLCIHADHVSAWEQLKSDFGPWRRDDNRRIAPDFRAK
jgi:hypothetical protein